MLDMKSIKEKTSKLANKSLQNIKENANTLDDYLQTKSSKDITNYVQKIRKNTKGEK